VRAEQEQNPPDQVVAAHCVGDRVANQHLSNLLLESRHLELNHVLGVVHDDSDSASLDGGQWWRDQELHDREEGEGEGENNFLK